MECKILNDGNKMPILGYGIFQVAPNIAQKCVEYAISMGYRSIDTAQAYFNEEGVGAAIKAALGGGLRRDELFITTKIWINNLDSKTKALKSIEASLKKLNLDYLDMLLIHQPYNDIYGAWRVMSKLREQRVLKSIGVSNFYADRLVDLCENTGVIPAINQLECHPFYQREELKKMLDSYGVAFWSWASFAEGKNGLFKNEILCAIGEKHGKSVAQVVLRWLIQRDIVVIPKSVNLERMRENFAVFDFALDDDDIGRILSLDTGATLFFNHNDPERAKYIINAWKDKF